MSVWRFAIVLALLSPLAQASTVLGDGFRIDLPADWTYQRDRMGVALIARPDRTVDAEGWGMDLLTVTREAINLQRTCLEGFSYRKLEQLAYHSERFAKLGYEELTLGGRPAGLFTVRYTEGPRELMGHVLILDAGSHMLTASALSSPARFEAKRAVWRHALESLRAQ
ncbi:hypothetical protein SAMN04488120_10778 [Fontimonas thermophila]|uniref:Uncharacterized protein n=1 Tax=Fontimonas thermophila TaxID=1076937 RepID=A0A1I2JH70_9GAMM|nr:hypothetical protein SAMN04488120_10778 [Fontimonas thermophila]